MQTPHHLDTRHAEAEKKRLKLMRQATTDANSKTNIIGNPKTRGSRHPPITLPNPELLRRILGEG